MFEDFRKSVKIILSKKKLTYSQLGTMTGTTESTIKCFMCGANDSRRIAEQIADALNCELVYSNGNHTIKEPREEVRTRELEILKNISTEELVQELLSRDGTERYVCELYKNKIRVEIKDNSVFGIQKQIIPTNCDVILISHDSNKEREEKSE